MFDVGEASPTVFVTVAVGVVAVAEPVSVAVAVEFAVEFAAGAESVALLPHPARREDEQRHQRNASDVLRGFGSAGAPEPSADTD